MSLRPVQQYRYQAPLEQQQPPFFELKVVELDIACVVNEGRQSEHYSIYFIEEGEGEYIVDFQPFRIQQAGLFFLTPGQVFQVNSEKVKRGFQINFDREFYCIETHGKEIACDGVLFNAVNGQGIIPLSSEQSQSLRATVERIVSELQEPGPAHLSMLETYLRLFIIEALRISQSQQIVKPEATLTTDHPLISSFNELINQNFRKEHSVRFYASELGISPKSLSKRLKALGYPTPSQLISTRIILQAKRLLRYSDKTIKEIAYELGFDDPAYFSRFFAKSAQIPPQQYRQG